MLDKILVDLKNPDNWGSKEDCDCHASPEDGCNCPRCTAGLDKNDAIAEMANDQLEEESETEPDSDETIAELTRDSDWFDYNSSI